MPIPEDEPKIEPFMEPQPADQNENKTPNEVVVVHITAESMPENKSTVEVEGTPVKAVLEEISAEHTSETKIEPVSEKEVSAEHTSEVKIEPMSEKEIPMTLNLNVNQLPLEETPEELPAVSVQAVDSNAVQVFHDEAAEAVVPEKPARLINTCPIVLDVDSRLLLTLLNTLAGGIFVNMVKPK